MRRRYYSPTYMIKGHATKVFILLVRTIIILLLTTEKKMAYKSSMHRLQLSEH